MAGVFMNYRRDDSAGYAGRLFDGLAARFGSEQIFRDIDRIEPGLDFSEVIDGSLKSCVAVLVLIGPSWLQVRNEAGALRLHEADDWVRLEIAQALRRGVRVIPVLLPGVRKMPDSDALPDDVKPLSRLHAFTLSEESWNAQLGKLTALLQRLGMRPHAAADRPKVANALRYGLMGLGGLFALGMLANLVIDDAPLVAALPPEPVPVPAKLDARVLSSPTEIMAVQLGLTSLGHYSGSIDGIAGPQTTAAVRSFQANQGVPQDGRMTVALLEQLQRQAAGQQVTAAVEPTPLPDISGTWYDNDSNRYEFQQNGSRITAIGYSPWDQPIGEYAGQLQGRQLTFSYDMPGEGTGSGVGMLQPDNQHIATRSTPTGGGIAESNQLHRGHLPNAGYAQPILTY